MRQRPYEKLIVWQLAHELCLQIYSSTKKFPSDERFGLISQMRRASYSIPMNLAEGNGRQSKKEKAHYVIIAIGSLEELHYQCRLASDLEYITADNKDSLINLIHRVGYLLHKLRSSIMQIS
ncbi:MAG: hypothetical protein JWM56_709 [Candidatus Peribacteria bacterium]|nr:hypothetical protein [Candidatus Peribacteria bacterium]